MPTTNIRYARYLVFAILVLCVVYLISTSSLRDYDKYTKPIKDGLKGGREHFGWPAPKPKQAPSTHAQDDLYNPKTEPTLASLSASSPLPKVSSDPEDGEWFRMPSNLDSYVSAVSPAVDTSLSPAAPGERVNATFVTLARNGDIWDIARSIRQVEDRFNRNYNYPWVFLNDKPFDEAFKKVTSSLVSGKTYYGEIPSEHWSFPSWIDQDKAKAVREDMAQRKIIYGDSVSYRHMCRFESGFFFRQPLMNQFEYYWRVEPSIELFCDIHYDPFKMMKDGKKMYSFVISLYEYVETIPTLWNTVKKFIQKHPEHLHANNALDWLSDDGGDTYNKCHFWSNFEIGNLDWLRSKAYLDFFETLDKDGGFFYERWGDAPVHSIAAALMLDKKDIHFFNDIAYYHIPFTHCPTGEDVRLKLRCHCDPGNNFDWKGYSCTTRWHEVAGLEKPKGWEEQIQ